MSAQPGQPTPDWTWVSLRSPPGLGEGPSVDPGPASLGSPAPPGGLYLYLWALTRKMHSKTLRWGRLLEFYCLVSLARVSKHLHQISNYLTFPLENLTSLEHLNLNFQVTSQQVYRICILVPHSPVTLRAISFCAKIHRLSRF